MKSRLMTPAQALAAVRETTWICIGYSIAAAAFLLYVTLS